MVIEQSPVSYHNFTFPFQWSIKGTKDNPLSEQIDLNRISDDISASWTRATCQSEEGDKNILYDEKNYFYKFIHDTLYDAPQKGKASLMRHYEWKESQPNNGKRKDVLYVIETNKKTYELKINAININFYSTGVGVLSFYLYNYAYPSPADVMEINQKGRRIFPPYIKSVIDREVIANSLSIKIDGNVLYKEDFTSYTNSTESNKHVTFIEKLIHEVAKNVILAPVVEDRMFVQCWYKNDDWASKVKEEEYTTFLHSDEWYEFVFVDEKGELSCLNRDMKLKLIEQASYKRWQQNSTLVGITRSSIAYLTYSKSKQEFLNTFETIYARMAELILIQKASVLRFSDEITNISKSSDRSKYFIRKVDSLYKEYIRFVNQYHFREVTAQTPGIELYQMLYNAFSIEKQVKKLDHEIEELYNYVTLQEENRTSSIMSILTWVATIALPITVIAGIFGMNNHAFTGDENGELKAWYNHFDSQFLIIIGITGLICLIIYLLLKRNGRR